MISHCMACQQEVAGAEQMRCAECDATYHRRCSKELEVCVTEGCTRGWRKVAPLSSALNPNVGSLFTGRAGTKLFMLLAAGGVWLGVWIVRSLGWVDLDNFQ